MFGAALSAYSLASLAGDGSSMAMPWLNMIEPAEDEASGQQHYSLEVVEEPTNNFVRMIKTPLNLMSVMGPARSGKSTLMNLLAGCKGSELFATYPGMGTFTKGIYIPTRILSLSEFSMLEGEAVAEETDPNIKVTFVDTEGQGAVGTAYDMNLFSPALVCSRVIMYNRTGGLLTEEILNQLGMMTEAAKRLKTAETGGGASNGNGYSNGNGHSNGHGDANGHANGHANGNGNSRNTPPRALFGHLFILFNQYRVNMVDTIESMTKALLDPEQGGGEAGKKRNEIRDLLKTSFESIQVFVLPDRLKMDARDALSDGTKEFLTLDDFDDRYLVDFKKLRSALTTALRQPRELVPGQPLTGGAMADFMPTFATAINQAEPLNLPSIFEASQNAAVNNAKAAFFDSQARLVEAHSRETRQSRMMGLMFDRDVNMLFVQLAATLSYMPASVVEAARQDCLAASAAAKTSLLETNLVVLRAKMSTALAATLHEVSNQVCNQVFPDDKLLVSVSEIDAQLATLSKKTIAQFKADAEEWDPKALPEGYEATFTENFELFRKAVVLRSISKWTSWVASESKMHLNSLFEGLVKLGDNTPVGEGDAYKEGSTRLLSQAASDFGSKLRAEYRGSEDTKELAVDFQAAAESEVRLQTGMWEKNDTKVQKSLARLLERLEKVYLKQLDDAITPRVEPADFSELTSSTALSYQLIEFLARGSVSAQLAEETKFKLDGSVSRERARFAGVYRTACEEYGTQIQVELDRSVPLLIERNEADIERLSLDVSKSEGAVTRSTIEKGCDGIISETKSRFDMIVRGLGVQNHPQGGAVSRSILDVTRQRLETSIQTAKTVKIEKFNTVVGAYNRALLAALTTPVVDDCLDNKFATKRALQDAVNRANAEFMSRARGDGQDASHPPAEFKRDATRQWEGFISKTSAAMAEMISYFNAFIVDGLSTKLTASREIQLKIIERVAADCGDLASMLNMAYASRSAYDGKHPEDRGQSGNKSRTFRITNSTIPDPNDNYKSDRATNLEFFDWEAEITHVVYGKPIVTEMKPLKLNTFEFPAQKEDVRASVTNTDTFTETITNSETLSFEGSIKSETELGWGPFKTKVEATFKTSSSSTSAKSCTTTFTSNVSAQVVLPANRINQVNQVVFDQRTSLPYTARVKVVPRLRFQNGFTVWGGGGSYRDNPKTGAIKDACKDGSRTFRDFEFQRVDRIQDDARANADPWEWRLAMERQPELTKLLGELADAKRYEVFVRGKWEGITGKYAVTTVTPKQTSLTMLP